MGLSADYLVVGAGAAGMAFTDELIAHADVEVVLLDRRHAPGGHWLDAYPFVRLHQPAAYYGVNSLPLAADTIDEEGPNRGMYVQASGVEIAAYYERVLRERLLASGRVRWLPMCEHQGGGRVASCLSGQTRDVEVRRAIVDARYLQARVPARTPAPFEVADGVRCVPVGELPQAAAIERPDRFVVVGAGKTAMDACAWLLDAGVAPAAIRWVKPREAWLQNRFYAQCNHLVGDLMEGLARQVEAAARASSAEDLFARLEDSGQLLRVDRSVVPTMFKAPTLSEVEARELRRIEDVVRLGHVRRVEPDRLVLARGEVPATPGDLYVHCAAAGLDLSPAVPVFAERTITLQPIRTGLIPFNAAMIGYVEATRHDLADKNRLCPANPLPDVPRDWLRGTLASLAADRAWAREPDVTDWLERARLNPSRGIRHRMNEPRVQTALMRFSANVRPGVQNLTRLLSVLS